MRGTVDSHRFYCLTYPTYDVNVRNLKVQLLTHHSLGCDVIEMRILTGTDSHQWRDATFHVDTIVNRVFDIIKYLEN